MIKNLIIVVLVLLSIGLTTVLVLRPEEKPPAAPEPAALVEPRVAATPAPPTAPEAPNPIPVRPAEPVEVAAVEVEVVEPEATPADQLFDPSGFAEMMEKPEFRKMMVAQQKMAMEQQYGEMFDMLELTPEDRNTLKDLLAERMGVDMDRGIKAMQAGGSPEEGLLEELTAAREEAQEAIKTFLGEEDFDLFEQYEATQPERMQVDMFKQGLASNEQLTWEQEDELVHALYEERMSFKFSTDLMDPNLAQMPSPDQMKVHMQEMGRLNEQYIARASELLTPAQADCFRENVENMVAMQEMAMGMAQKMFGGDEAEE